MQSEKPKTGALAETDNNLTEDNDEERVMKMMKTIREISDKYQKEHPDVAVESGTLARKTELEGIISNLRARIGKIEDILNAKLGFMDPNDIDRLNKIAQRRKEIGQEKQENDSVIYGKDSNDMGAKGEATRKNIKLENEEEGLYAETEQMFETKYKGLGRI